MNRILKYILLTVIVGFLGYHSVYFKKLSEVKDKSAGKFDAVAFSKKLWEEQMPAKMDSAIDLYRLVKEIETNKESALDKYTNALGIGNYRYALVSTAGSVTTVNEDELLIAVPFGDTVINLVLATEYIYGNAIRDASGLIDVKDFPETENLNRISEEMNKQVRSTVLPSFKKNIRKGDKVNIVAAVEINREHIKWDELELIPVRLQIVQ